MRALLFLLALGVGGYAVYVGFFEGSPFSGHSSTELDVLSYEAFQTSNQTKDFRKKHEADATHQLIADERQRRLRLYGAAGGAGVLALAALVWPKPKEREKARRPGA